MRSSHRAIVYLTQNNPVRRVYLQTSLYFLFKYYNARWKYPVLILHEGDFTSRDADEIREGVPMELGDLLEFVHLSSDAPKVPPEMDDLAVARNRLIVPDARDLRYRAMCEWWIGRAPEVLGEFDLYMRLDDDSFIESEFRVDPFQIMADRNLDYASNLIHLEHPLNALGFETLAISVLGSLAARLFVAGPSNSVVVDDNLRHFLAGVAPALRNKIDPMRLSSPVMYYNNFHVARPASLNTGLMGEFAQATIESGGIFELRWGDAMIQSVGLLASGARTARFNFSYSKRYEREQGPYVNTNHPFALPFFDHAEPTIPSGSLTDFAAFVESGPGRSIGGMEFTLEA